MPSQYNFCDNLIDLSFILLSFFSVAGTVLSSSYKRRRFSASTYVFYFTVLLVCFAVYGNIDLDYFSYENALKWHWLSGYDSYLEPFYYCLADFVHSYFLWRLCIWGCAAIIMIYTIKRLKMSFDSTYFFIIVFYAFSFYKLRSSLASSLVFWGISYLVLPNYRHKLISYIGGIILVMCSYWLHKSMPVTFLIMIISIFFPFNKKSIVVSLISFPIIILLVTLLVKIFLVTEFSVQDDQLAMTLKTGANYAAADPSSGSSIFGKIRLLLFYGPMYLGLYIVTKDVVFRHKKLPQNIYYFYKFWFVMTYAASLFFTQQVAFWMYIRFMTMMYFPMCLILGYYYRVNKYSTLMKILLVASSVAFLLDSFYPIYKRFIEI